MRLAAAALIALITIPAVHASAAGYPGYDAPQDGAYGYPQENYPAPQGGYPQAPAYGGYSNPVAPYGGNYTQPYQSAPGYNPAYRDPRSAYNEDRVIRGYTDPREAYQEDTSIARRAQREAAVSGSRVPWGNSRTHNHGVATGIGYPHQGRDYRSTCRLVEESIVINGASHLNRGDVCLTREAFGG